MPKAFVNEGRTNAEYLADWKDDPWYEVLVDTDRQLEEVAPGYGIAQIKEKFGGLRYYLDLPQVLQSSEMWRKVHEITDEAERRCREIDTKNDGK